MSNGVIFQHARDILFEKMQQGVINVTQGNSGRDGKATLDASLFVVVAVNTAFSCELFLKAMLPKGTKGHRLDTLFVLLDDDIQERIKGITIDKMKLVQMGSNPVTLIPLPAFCYIFFIARIVCPRFFYAVNFLNFLYNYCFIKRAFSISGKSITATV